jgi:hypothetical protein
MFCLWGRHSAPWATCLQPFLVSLFAQTGLDHNCPIFPFCSWDDRYAPPAKVFSVETGISWTFLPGLTWNHYPTDLSLSHSMTGMYYCTQLLVEIESYEVFAWAGLKTWFAWFQPPTWQGLYAWATSIWLHCNFLSFLNNVFLINLHLFSFCLCYALAALIEMIF